jgi:membrane-associated protein
MTIASILQVIANIALHFDYYLLNILNHYGSWAYLILFIIIFCESGVILMPFLPGDSLLISAGTLIANVSGQLNINLLFVLLLVAATLGNQCNYHVGYNCGENLGRATGKYKIKPQYLLETQKFYHKYGAKTIVIARFIPIARTFAPFIAGVIKMPLDVFFGYSTVGAFLWLGSLLYPSYYFGNLPIIRNHLNIIVLLVVFCSVLPAIIAYWQKKS